MRHLLNFKIFESLEEIHYYKEFPQIDPLIDLLAANHIFDYDVLTDEDIQKIKNIFEKTGFYYHREIKMMEHYLDVLVNDSEEYVDCHIEIRKHLEDWYEVIFYKKKKTPFGENSYTQKLEFNRWLCDGMVGINKLLKKIVEDYTWLKTPVGEVKLLETINLDEINYFTELNMDDDNIADFVENNLQVSDYDITQEDVDFILNTNNKLGLEFKHEVKIHAGRGGKEKKVLMIWYNKGNVKNTIFITLIVNIRRIKDDYFYVFTDARGNYNEEKSTEKKYFLCDGLPGLMKFFKHIKNDYLTI